MLRSHHTSADKEARPAPTPAHLFRSLNAGALRPCGVVVRDPRALFRSPFQCSAKRRGDGLEVLCGHPRLAQPCAERDERFALAIPPRRPAAKVRLGDGRELIEERAEGDAVALGSCCLHRGLLVEVVVRS